MTREAFYIRLKPYNPKRGYKLRTYSVFGLRFKVDAGWYRIDDANVARYLKTVHNDNNDPESPLAFDVATEDEWKGILADEHRERIRKGEIRPTYGNVVDMTQPSVDERNEFAAKRVAAEEIGKPHAVDVGAITTADLPRPTRMDSPAAPSVDELPPEPMPPVETKGDDLTALDGVGESTAAKLVDAGFPTYEAVAKADTAAIKEIVGRKAKKLQAEAAKLTG